MLFSHSTDEDIELREYYKLCSVAQRVRAPRPSNLRSLAFCNGRVAFRAHTGEPEVYQTHSLLPVAYREGCSTTVGNVGLYLVAWVPFNILSVTWSLALN